MTAAAAPAAGRWPRRLLAPALLLGVLAWLGLRAPPAPPAADPRLVEREFLSMGTLVSITLHLAPGQTREAASAAIATVETDLANFERRWSAWGPGELGDINRALAAGRRAALPEALRPLLDLAAELAERSGGLFDPRVGALVRLWGFDDESHFRSAPPPDAELQALLAGFRSAPPLVAGADGYGPAAGVEIDLGAIAKGYAVDRIVADLRARGFADLIVNAGGNLRAAGVRGARPWRIGIRHPRPETHGRVLASLAIDGDEAVITSGDYQRYFESDGRRYHHILDPRSGRPAEGLQSVTVVHREAAVGDAASTALFVAGADGWRALARRLGLEQVLVVDGEGRVFATAALAPRLELAEGLSLERVP